MKQVPMRISTLNELTEWCISYCPKKLVIGKRSCLRKIREFSPIGFFSWRTFRGLEIVYL